MIHKNSITVGFRPDGSQIKIPLIKIKGKSTEPKIFIGASIHGNELTGQVSIWRLIDYLKDREVKGELTIIPTMNPEGFNYNVRGIPSGAPDLNRLYPGDPKGSLAERIVAKIWEIAKKHEFIIDMHTAGNCIPFILLDPAPPELRRRIEEIAYASEITVLDEFPPEKYERIGLAKSLPAVAVKEGIPAFTVELPGFRGVNIAGAKAGFIALKNMLVKLEIIEDSFEKINFIPVIREKGYRRETVYAEKPGLLEYVKELGDKVYKGEVIARVRNVFGEVIEEIKSPWNGYIISLNPTSTVGTGGYVASMAIKIA
ncbi:MAG: succinylglutamate desuccinylase/aspartoacylase family protein [archaeon GB-1867-005]|nr:succinylglutamate desuccinylase/aspartoacylase family protein [Candidatus Culexmicrobium cathedralense]